MIGAGISGLIAARDLHRLGHRVLVVEAQDRLGGCLLHKLLPSGQWIDHGGQWVGPTQDRILALLDEYGLRWFASPAQRKKVLVYNGRHHEFDGFFPR